MFGIKRIGLVLVLVSVLALGFAAASLQAQAVPLGSDYQWVEVVNGFNSPVLVTGAGDDSGRLFVAEQDGYIFVVRDGKYDESKPFLDIHDLLSQDVFQGGYTERGLLGLAFHPDFKNNGVFFINHTDRAGDNIIARYHVDTNNPDVADPSSRVELLKIHQLFYDHNGGAIQFGPDGYLYIGVGDGGSLGDSPGVTSQDLTTMLGKVLRIDVDADTYTVPPDNPFVNTSDAKPEIWAYGLRNPWKLSFDRLTGDLYIADVGQTQYEEIDFQEAGAPGGANYGWMQYEGMHPYKKGVAPENMTLPVAEYPHLIGCSVSGGNVYRGSDLPELQGIYFFGDYCSGRTWTLFRDETDAWRVQPFMQTGFVITAFGLDDAGELYLVNYKGGVYRLARAEAS